MLDALEAAYGPRVRQHRLSAIDELVATILSQNTSDVNTDRAFAGLRSRFAGWDDVAAAPTAEVVDAIRVGGLANQKGPQSRQCCASWRPGPRATPWRVWPGCRWTRRWSA